MRWTKILWPKEEKLRIDEQFWNMVVPLGRCLDPAGIIREIIRQSKTRFEDDTIGPRPT